jgi:hypothetical protein
MAQAIQTSKFGTLDTSGRIPVYFTGAEQDANTPALNLGLSFTINGKNYTFIPEERISTGAATANDGRAFPGFLNPALLSSLKNNSEYVDIAGTQFGSFDIGNYIAKQMGGSTKGYLATEDVVKPIIDAGVTLYNPAFAGRITGVGSAEGRPVYSVPNGYLTPEGKQTKTTSEIIGWRESGGLGGLGSFLASIDPSTAISRELTNVYQPVEKAITAGVEEVSKALSTDDAKKAMAIAAAYYLPGVGSALGQSLVTQGLITGAAIPYAAAIGTALASTGASVAQGVPFDTALTNATVNAVTSTGSQSVAGYISKLGASPEVANAVTSVGASGLATAAKGGSAADIERNMTGALAGSTITGMTGDKIAGAAVGGQITGGTTGALLGAAGAAGARDAKEGASTTTAPTTQATLTQDLTDAQVSQIQNALGISVSDATNNDVKLALGPLLAPMGAGAAIVSDSVIPLIGIFGAKAVSDTIDYFKAQNDSSGFYQWVNENMQAADDRVQNKLSLNPAGAGRGFVNPPVATPITPSQAAISGSYGAGFSGAGGGAGAGVTAGEATAGEAEARDFLVAQKVTNPEIDFATLAQEPALNEPPTDQKIIDLIQPGAASTSTTVPPGTAPADRDILALSGITQPAGSTAVTTPTQVAPVAGTVPVTPATFIPAVAPGRGVGRGVETDEERIARIDKELAKVIEQETAYAQGVKATTKLPAPVATPGQATSANKTTFTPATFSPAVTPIGGEETDAERIARIDAQTARVLAGEADYTARSRPGTGTVPETPTRPANQPVVDTFDFPKVTPADQAVIDLITPPATTPIGEPPPFVPPAVEPPVTTPPVVSEPPPDVVEPPPVVTEPPVVEVVDPNIPAVDEPVVEDKPPVVDKPVIDDKPPPDDEKPLEEEEPPEEEDKPPGEKEDEYKPEIFIYGGKEPPRRPRPELRTTLQGPFAPSTTLGQALTGYRGAGEIEGKKTGKPRKNVWNEESLRLKDALGL